MFVATVEFSVKDEEELLKVVGKELASALMTKGLEEGMTSIPEVTINAIEVTQR